jgi:hypothetical protein
MAMAILGTVYAAKALFEIPRPLTFAILVAPVAVFSLWSGLNDWKRSVRLLGILEGLRIGWRLAGIRHRQTFRAMMLSAPGFTLLPLVIAVGYLSLAWTGSFADPWLFVSAVAIVTSVGLLLTNTTPPVSLFLGSSQYGGFETMKRMRAQGCPIISLVDQASPNVLEHYDRHYGAVIEAMPQGPRRIAKVLRPFADPTAPRFDSVRTRSTQWRRTVLELMDYLPLLVLDARNTGRQIQQEALWALAPSRRHKVLFISDDEGFLSPLMNQLTQLGLTLDGCYIRVFTEDHACEIVRAMMQSGAPLRYVADFADAPQIDAEVARAQENFTLMESIYKDLLARARAGTGPDRALDEDLARLRGPPAFEDAPHFTSSLDAALDLANNLLNLRPGQQSYQINIMIDGMAEASIGVQDRPGNLRVFRSRVSDNLSPPRALLVALLHALLA